LRLAGAIAVALLVAPAPALGSPPTASAESSAPTAFRNQDVTFTVTASDPEGDETITARDWDLDDDGQFDDAQGAAVTTAFSTPGEKAVHVRVTDDQGETAFADAAVTIVNRAPVVDEFARSSAEAFRGQDVTFAAVASDPDGDGTIAAREWDLDGDGQFDDAQGAGVTHSFGTLGVKTVQVRVTDDAGATATAQTSVTIVNRFPLPGFTFRPVEPVAGQVVTFTSASEDPDGTPLAHSWDLDGDGSYDDATGSTASRAFSAGSHSVALRADDGDGGVVTVSRIFPVAAAGVAPAPPPPPPPPPPAAPSVAAPSDVTAPAIRAAAVKGQRLRAVLANGLRLVIRFREPVAGRIRLTVDRATARRFGVVQRPKRRVLVGWLYRPLAAGRRKVAVKFTPKARTTLRRARRLTLRVSVAARDAAGNRARRILRVTLKR
jgi:PKD repeat protein